MTPAGGDKTSLADWGRRKGILFTAENSKLKPLLSHVRHDTMSSYLFSPAVVIMHDSQFDPFGEPVAHSLRGMFAQTGRQGPGSRLLLRSGVGLFWMLVIGVVAARVAYFDPGFAEKFGSVAALSKYLHALFA